MKTNLKGFFAEHSSLKNKEGQIKLYSNKIGATNTPFLPAIERLGIFAIVQGDYQNGALYNVRILEAAPSWISQSLKLMLEKGEMTWENLYAETEAAKKIIIGPQVETEPDRKRPHLVIDIGHSLRDPGACSATFNVCEFGFNTEIANLMKPLITTAKVSITSRDNTANGYSTLPAKLNALNPDFIISLHVNAATPQAQGTEMLYYHTSKNSHSMAKIMQRHVLSAFNFRNRYTKPIKDGDRGVHLLKFTKAPCIITEPFFFSNDRETQKVLNNKQKLVDAYVAGIDEIVKTLFG